MENYPACKWHTDPAPDNPDRNLMKYINDAQERTYLFLRLERDLKECWDCMGVYHEARERLIHKKPKTMNYDRVSI